MVLFRATGFAVLFTLAIGCSDPKPAPYDPFAKRNAQLIAIDTELTGYDSRLHPAILRARERAQDWCIDRKCVACHTAMPVPTLGPVLPNIYRMLNKSTVRLNEQLPTVSELPVSIMLLQKIRDGEAFNQANQQMVAHELSKQTKAGCWTNPYHTFPFENGAPLPTASMLRLIRAIQSHDCDVGADVYDEMLKTKENLAADFLRDLYGSDKFLSPFERLSIAFAFNEGTVELKDTGEPQILAEMLTTILELQLPDGSWPAKVILKESDHDDGDVLSTAMVIEALRTRPRLEQEAGSPEADAEEAQRIDQAVAWLWQQQGDEGLWPQLDARYHYLCNYGHALVAHVLSQSADPPTAATAQPDAEGLTQLE